MDDQESPLGERPVTADEAPPPHRIGLPERTGGPRRHRTAHAGRWVLVAVGALVLLVGWRSGMSWVYLGGLAFVVVALPQGPRLHPRVAVGMLPPLALLLGIAGPWAAIQLAYGYAGTDADDDLTGATSLPSDDNLLRVSLGSRVRALTREAETAWWAPSDIGRVVRIWPVAGDRLVIDAEDGWFGLGPAGTIDWRLPDDPGAWVVASSGHTVVMRKCADAASGPQQCTWTGIDTLDGRTTWTVDATAGDAVLPDDARADTTVEPALPAAFATSVAAGSGSQIRDAATGDVVLEVAAGVRPWLLGDAVLVLTPGSGTCPLELFRAGESLWRTEVDCAMDDTIDDAMRLGGWREGDVFWTDATADGPTLVVDLRDGTTTVGPDDYVVSGTHPYGDGVGLTVLGAGVRVDMDAEALTVRDPATGAEIWHARVRASDVRSVHAFGEVVVVETYNHPLILHEWFAPRDARTTTVVMYEAGTGRRLRTVRSEASSLMAPTPVGDDGVLVLDPHGNGDVRLVLAPTS